MKNKWCYQGGNKHKFQPRYDEVPNLITNIKGETSAEEFRKLIYYTVYVKDVCMYCGKEIKK